MGVYGGRGSNSLVALIFVVFVAACGGDEQHAVGGEGQAAEETGRVREQVVAPLMLMLMSDGGSSRSSSGGGVYIGCIICNRAVAATAATVTTVVVNRQHLNGVGLKYLNTLPTLRRRRRSTTSTSDIVLEVVHSTRLIGALCHDHHVQGVPSDALHDRGVSLQWAVRGGR